MVKEICKKENIPSGKPICPKRFKCLQLIVESKCFMGCSACLEVADNIELLKYLHENGCQCPALYVFKNYS